MPIDSQPPLKSDSWAIHYGWLIPPILPEGFLKEDKAKKSRWDLIRFKCVDLIGQVLAFGDGKHAADGWVDVSFDEHFASFMRHVSARRSGEKLDTGPGGSGLPHLGHAFCRLMFLLAMDIGDLPRQPKSENTSK
jgi:hypothetical protein